MSRTFRGGKRDAGRGLTQFVAEIDAKGAQSDLSVDGVLRMSSAQNGFEERFGLVVGEIVDHVTLAMARGPVVVDTDVFSARLIATSLLGRRYEPLPPAGRGELSLSYSGAPERASDVVAQRVMVR